TLCNQRPLHILYNGGFFAVRRQPALAIVEVAQDFIVRHPLCRPVDDLHGKLHIKAIHARLQPPLNRLFGRLVCESHASCPSLLPESCQPQAPVGCIAGSASASSQRGTWRGCAISPIRGNTAPPLLPGKP